MESGSGDLVRWAMAEWDRLESVVGEEGLEGRWRVAGVLLEAGDLDGAIDMLRELMELAKDEASLDWQVRGYGEIKRIYSTDPRYSDLRQDVLWYSKWIGGGLAGFADLPEATILGLLDEMQRIYEREGESLRPVYGERLDTAMEMGRREEAEKWFEQWSAAKKSPSDDCQTCELDRQVAYWVFRGEPDAAMEVGKELMQTPSECSNLPAALSRLMGVAAHLGDTATAMALFGRSCRWVRTSPAMLGSSANHILVMAQFGEVRRGRRLVASSLYRSKGIRNDGQRLRILRAAALWAGLTLVTGREADWGKPVTIPRCSLPGKSDEAEGSVGLAEIATTCLDSAWTIARKLDARNVNSFYHGKMTQVEELILVSAERFRSGGL